MHSSTIKRLVFVAVATLAILLSPSSFAQITTAGMSGVVRDTEGKPVAGAAVTATHLPTNAVFRTVSSAQGRYAFRGLPVGGPYSVSATLEGDTTEPLSGVYALLGSDVEANLLMRSSVVVLEEFVAVGSRSDLDPTATGTGMTLDAERLSAKPSSERSLADLISASPLVTLRDTFGDREESQLSAVGQNNRYNSIQIDGSRINDLFGLNATGLASFYNPLSVDDIEQLSIDINPYDVRKAGFTGASVNVVTKSGTNEFHGDVTYIFRGDSVFGLQMHGINPRESSVSGTRIIPRLERETYRVSLRGPIIKNRLFFALSYDDFKSVSAGRDERGDTTFEGAILSRLDQITSAAGKSIDWGSPVTGATVNTTVEEKINAKVDWKINENHSLTARYTKTEGELPQFGNFGNGTSNLNGVNGGITITPDGHFYSQTRVEETYSAKLNSRWTSNLSTEFRYSTTVQDQNTPLNTVAPMVLITGVTATDLINGQVTNNASYVAGTEQFRHGNVIQVDNEQIGGVADYVYENFVFTLGFEREQTDFYNLFRNGSYGTVAYRNYADFLADANAVIQRNVYDPNVRDVADVSDFATTGVFFGTTWDVSSRLKIQGGLRYEFTDSATPPLNQAFVTATGFRNDGSPDGASSLSPRLGFNLALDAEGTTRIRGGIGHFTGRAPWVIFSNSWNAPGVGSGTLLSAQSQLPTSLTAYLRDHFDPENPIGTFTDNPAIRREVDWVDDGIDMPSSWSANLAVDQKVPFLDTILSAEIVLRKVDTALFVTNENLRPTTLGADGRQRFAGNPNTQNNARFSGYTNLIHVQNTDVGESTYATIQWSRPMKNRWGFDLSYTRGKSTEAQSIGQTTAGGQWFRNAVFNQNEVEEGTSDFETKDRVQLSIARKFEFIKKAPTTASIYYEGRTGQPYSWVFGGDLNGDGQSFNDRVAVPTDINDARFNFSAMGQAERDAFFAYLESSGLSAYAGGVAPKNAFVEPWVNRLDLKIAQEVPIRGPAKLILGLDFINFGSFISKSTFGYTEISPFLSNGVFRTRTLTTGSTTYDSSGRIQPRFASQPVGFNVSNEMSRWRIQLTAKLVF